MKFVHVQRITIATRFQLRKIQIVIFLVLYIEIRRAQRHRTVDVNRYARNLLCILKLPQVIHERLRASNCERGNTMEPPRLATRFTMSASMEAGSPASCSRSPYVDSHSRTSARGRVAGSFKIGSP